MLHCLQLQFAPRGTIPHENYGDGSSPRLWVEIADFSLTLGVQRKSKGILKECCHTALQQIARGGGGGRTQQSFIERGSTRRSIPI